MISAKTSRLLYLIHLLKTNKEGISKDDIVSQIIKKFKNDKPNFTYNHTKFERDKTAINEFGFEIKYDRKNIIYTVENIDNNERLDLMLNSFKVFSTLMKTPQTPEHIIPEKRKSTGLEHFSDIAEAIGDKNYISFHYYKFENESFDIKKIKPLALKESKNRWYVIGQYENKEDFRAFGLDRIKNLAIEEPFKTKTSIDTIEAHYADSFAMFTDEAVEDVVLTFDLRDGNYIKTFPIHQSQICELAADQSHYVVKLKIRITLDFMMELMSRAWSVKVIEPQHLKDRLAVIFEEAYQRNNH